jgi:hypothetical protein
LLSAAEALEEINQKRRCPHTETGKPENFFVSLIATT